MVKLIVTFEDGYKIKSYYPNKKLANNANQCAMCAMNTPFMGEFLKKYNHGKVIKTVVK